MTATAIADPSSTDPGKDPNKHMLGEEMIWVFLLGDMSVFSLFFCAYLNNRASNLELFQQSQSLLNVNYGVVNTMLLLASSWFVVGAVAAVRRNSGKTCSRMLAWAFLCGAAFSVIKYFEYSEKIAAGLTFGSNDFFIFYYVLTGIHFAHLLVGLSLLGYFCFTTRLQPEFNEVSLLSIASTAIYWHMVDLLWIIIFPLLYLLP